MFIINVSYLVDIGYVATWVVLPVQTYRDEVILLAELTQPSGAKKVVTLTWASSGIFNWQNQPPCFVEGAKFSMEGTMFSESLIIYFSCTKILNYFYFRTNLPHS